MGIDIKSLSRRELVALKGRIEKRLKSLDKADMKKAIEAAEAAARQHGFSLSELARTAPTKRGSPKKAAKKESVARFANPEDPSATWSGRGRRPDWIRAGLEAGKSLDDFAIK